MDLFLSERKLGPPPLVLLLVSLQREEGRMEQRHDPFSFSLLFFRFLSLLIRPNQTRNSKGKMSKK